MTQIVDPGAAPPPCFWFSEGDVLADPGEGVPGNMYAQPPSVLADEERRWQGAENPVPHGAVGAEAFDGACRERNDATPSVRTGGC